MNYELRMMNYELGGPDSIIYGIIYNYLYMLPVCRQR